MNEQTNYPLEADEENVLKAALSTAFHSPRGSVHQDRQQSNIPNIPAEADFSAVDPVPAEQTIEKSTSQSTDDPWKAEYEAQVESWRAKSAEAGEKAEKERARWEAIRAAEKADASRQSATVVAEAQVLDSDLGWETVGVKASDPSSSQQPTYSLSEFRSSANTGVAQELHSVQATAQSIHSTHFSRDTGDDNKLSSSQKWEDLHSSQTSSFPSMSFPDNPETPSSTMPAPPAAPFSATLAVFDSTLPTRTRVLALFSSLAINMLLPFVNGVMLGFGEIFAKNVILGWFGWRMSGTVTNVGVGVRSPSERKRRT